MSRRARQSSFEKCEMWIFPQNSFLISHHYFCLDRSYLSHVALYVVGGLFSTANLLYNILTFLSTRDIFSLTSIGGARMPLPFENPQDDTKGVLMISIVVIGVLVAALAMAWMWLQPFLSPKRHCGKKMKVICDSVHQRHFQCQVCGERTDFGI